MNDFKKMPKMACGGGVKKMAEGGDIVAEARKAVRAGKDLDSGMLRTTKPTTMNFDGKDVPISSVEMPNRFGSSKPRTRNMFGEDVPVNPTPTRPRGNLELLKKGGKAKKK
jgi:hypothetical protein